MKFLLATPVADSPGDAVPSQKWLHVATEGDFAGHADGQFSLDCDVFNAFVRNFRAHPQYQQGPDGVGDRAVLPFDYEHASEMSATAGSIPTSGAPAPAWVLELDVRDGASGSELWALADLGDQVRKQIAANEYKFTSIAFTLDGTDARTGRSVGPSLTSIAFTNHPFLRNLQPLQIAASARGRGAPRVMFADPVSSEVADDQSDSGRVPVDLAGTPIDINAPDAVSQVVEHFRRLDPKFDSLSRADQIAHAAQCIAFTKQEKAERAGLAPESDQEGNDTTMSDPIDKLGLTAEEFQICVKAKLPFDAAHQILRRRDPRGYALRPDLPQHRQKALALEQRLVAAEQELNALLERPPAIAVELELADQNSVAPPRVKVEPMKRFDITLEELRAFYPGANDGLKAAAYLQTIHPPMKGLRVEDQVNRGWDLVRYLQRMSPADPLAAAGGAQ